MYHSCRPNAKPNSIGCNQPINDRNAACLISTSRALIRRWPESALRLFIDQPVLDLFITRHCLPALRAKLISSINTAANLRFTIATKTYRDLYGRFAHVRKGSS